MNRDNINRLVKAYKVEKKRFKELKESELARVNGGDGPFDIPAFEKAGDEYNGRDHCRMIKSCSFKSKAECAIANSVSNCRFG